MPPCNCHPPFPRPEPFSPLPRPGRVPDWGKWIRDRLSEKGALLAFPSASAFPDPGAQPNVYEALDTGILYRWDGTYYQVLVDPSAANDVLEYEDRGRFPETGRAGAVYIDASANLLYRWDGAGYVPLTADLSGVESRLADVESKVPAQATAQNQLADKAFVNSSVATNTANYVYKTVGGRHVPFDSLAELQAYEGALTNNDYAFVVGADAAGNTTYTRYKWNGATEAWAEEYVLNNSSFTAAQWAAINSGITSGAVAKLGALPTAAELTQALAGKVPTSRTVNGKALSSDVTLTGADIAVSGSDPTKIDAALAGKATKADATLTEKWTPTFALTDAQKEVFSQTPGASDNDYALTIVPPTSGESYTLYVGSYSAAALRKDPSNITNLILTGGDARLGLQPDDIVATLSGYQLGSQSDKPLASEAEAEALRTGKQNALSAQQLANIAAVSDALAFDATHSYAAGDPVVYDGTLYTFTATHTGAWTGSDVSAVDIIARLAGKLDKSGGTMTGALTMNEQVGIGFGDGALRIYQANGSIRVHDFHTEYESALIPDGSPYATRFNIPYDLGTPIVINTASSDPEGEMIYFGAATLADHTANIVQVIAPLDELRITFPAATSGKVRDFGLRVEIGTGSAALAAPALVPVAPTGETIKLENADGAIPALADGTATAKGATLLYFSETAPGVFVVKGEQVEEVA